MNISEYTSTCTFSDAKLVLQAYTPILALNQQQIKTLGIKIPIPEFPEQILNSLCYTAIKSMRDDKNVIRTDLPAAFVGDIHGNLHDLLRCLSGIGTIADKRIIFLGDYVDRGDYSIDVITLLFAMKACFPKNIYLIRGNHEFKNCNEFYGFKDEVQNRYQNTKLYELFNVVFSFMPLAVILSNVILCVHGGISPHFTSLLDLNRISYPLETMDSDLVTDLVWSDPSHNVMKFTDSFRGSGVRFGPLAIQEFFESTGIQLIVRGHECVQMGFKFFDNRKVITVFSTSCYNDCDNHAAYIDISTAGNIESHMIPADDFIKRSKATFHMIRFHMRPRAASGATSLSAKSRPMMPMHVPRHIETRSTMNLLPKLRS